MSRTILGLRPHWKTIVHCTGDREKTRKLMLALECTLRKVYKQMRHKSYGAKTQHEDLFDEMLRYGGIFLPPYKKEGEMIEVLNSADEAEEADKAAKQLNDLRCYETPSWPPYTQEWNDVKKAWPDPYDGADKCNQPMDDLWADSDASTEEYFPEAPTEEELYRENFPDRSPAGRIWKNHNGTHMSVKDYLKVKK